MQKAATSLLDTQKEAQKPKVVELIKIGVDEDKKIYVNWPTDKKELCIIALAEAIKLVATYQAPQIIRPKPSFLDFVRGVKR